MKREEVAIRPARTGDAAAIAGLSRLLGHSASARQTEGRLEALLRAREHRVLVAIVEQQVVGWIHVFLAQRLESDPFAELGGFVVGEAHRRRGIGRRLLAEAEEWATACGLAKLRVRFRPARDDARSFYERLGFAMNKEQDVFDKILQAKEGTR